MNIEINIETLLFGNDAYTDHTNSKMFEKVRFILLSRKTDYVLQVSSFCFIWGVFLMLLPFLLFALIHDLFVYLLFLIL